MLEIFTNPTVISTTNYAEKDQDNKNNSREENYKQTRQYSYYRVYFNHTHKEVIKHGILCLIFGGSLPQVSEHPVQVEAVHHVGDVLAGAEAQWRPVGGEAPGVEILSAGGDQPADPADLGLVQQTLVPGQTRQT